MKIHWPKTLAQKKKRESYCGNPSWKSLSSNAENVSCRMCVRRMIKDFGYSGNVASGVYLVPSQ